jgi:hypothetical protein
MALTAATVIDEMRRLPPGEQAQVIRFAYELDAARKLSGNELSALAARMITCTDPKDIAVVREAIARGFYGTGDDA